MMSQVQVMQTFGTVEMPKDLRECSWYSPRTVGVLNRPAADDLVQQKFLGQLLDAFRQQGHTVIEDPKGAVNLMLAFFDISEDKRPIVDRIPERELPLALSIMREYGLSKRPDNLVGFVTIRERLHDVPHTEVIEAARTTMARLGVPKVIFLSGNRKTGELYEATYNTLEGGHPTDTQDIAFRLRDRLVSAACAREVGADYEVVENKISNEAWARTRTPEALIEAGHRMAMLNLLPAPKKIHEYVSPNLARIYERYMNMKGFSEGMLFAFDPDTGTLMVTASGSWEVDKRALRREEVVAIGGMANGKIQVWAAEGVKPKGPSVEAMEMYTLLESVPTVRLSRNGSNGWKIDPHGSVIAPVIRGGIHVHVGVESIDDRYVENIAANRNSYPYGFGCGTDLMKELAQDAARRSNAIKNPSDSRMYVRWPMLYHGDTVVELWKPGNTSQPLQGLLDMYDPERVGAIKYTPDHIHQLN